MIKEIWNFANSAVVMAIISIVYNMFAKRKKILEIF